MTRTYEQRVRAYEAQGMTRSDAQGIVDLEDMRASKAPTPTRGPWRVEENHSLDLTEIMTDDEHAPYVATVHHCRPDYEANAAFIVRACNAHESMNDALLSAWHVLKEVRNVIDEEDMPELAEALAKIHAARRLAERRG